MRLQKLSSALAMNHTRASHMAGENSTTESVMLEWIASELQGSWFNPELVLVSVWSFACSRFPLGSLVSSGR